MGNYIGRTDQQLNGQMGQKNGILKANCIGGTAQQLNGLMEQNSGILKIKGTGLNGLMEQKNGISMVNCTGRTGQQLNIQMGQNTGILMELKKKKFGENVGDKMEFQETIRYRALASRVLAVATT